jgi:uncharacterized protein (TIGR00369 family)
MSSQQFQHVVEFFNERIPFNQYVGMHLTSISEGRAELRVPYRPELVGDPYRPALHGGVLSALIDAAGGAACFSRVQVGDKISTIDLRVDYLRPAELKEVVADAEVLRVGNRVASVDVRVYHPDSPDRIIASGKAVYSIRRSDAPQKSF